MVMVEVLTHQRPIVYRVQDQVGEGVLGTFYEQELQKVQAPDPFKIERVIRTKGRGRAKRYLVKWLGYPESFNSWVGEDDLA